MRIQFIIFISAILTSSISNAWYSTIDTGEIIPKGQYRLSTEGQLATTGPTGLNVIGRFDMGVNESSNFRFLLGTGATALQSGVFFKWVPIPDYENQPAIGFLGGVEFAREAGISFFSARIHPLVSKKFVTDIGKFTPVGSLPFGVTASKGPTQYPLQIVLGSEFQPNDLEKISFMIEGGLNLNDAFSYISVAAILAFDEENGIELR